MQTRADFAGLEFDWFAVDAEGFIALFASAGYGPVPDAVFAHLDGQQAIDQKFRLLARVSHSILLQQQSQALAAQGVYTYDWTATYGPYQRYAVPAQPAKLTEFGFSPELQAAFVSLAAVHFSVVTQLQAADVPTFTASTPEVPNHALQRTEAGGGGLFRG